MKTHQAYVPKPYKNYLKHKIFKLFETLAFEIKTLESITDYDLIIYPNVWFDSS